MEYLEIVTVGRDLLNILRLPRLKLDNLWWQVVIEQPLILYKQLIANIKIIHVVSNLVPI